MNYLFFIAVLIVFALSVVAGYYLLKLKQLRLRQHRQALELEGFQRTQRKKNVKSIIVIAQAILEEQITIPEAAIRLSVLLESLHLSEEDKAPYISFFKLAQAISHVPILENWKKLSRNEKKEYQQQLDTQENHYRDFILESAKALVNNGEKLFAKASSL